MSRERKFDGSNSFDVPPGQAIDHTHKTLLFLGLADSHSVGGLLFDEFETTNSKGRYRLMLFSSKASRISLGSQLKAKTI